MKNQQEKSEFELIKDLFNNWLKHWYYFVISFAICLGLGIMYLKVKAPVFSIESKILLRSDDASGLKEMPLMKSLGFSMGKSSGPSITDEADMLTSYGNIKKMVKNLKINNMYTLSEYWGIKKTDLFDRTPIEVKYPDSFPDSLPGVIKFTLDAKGENLSVKMKLNKDDIGTYQLKSLPASIQTPVGEFGFVKTPFYGLYKKSFDLTILIFNYNLQAQIYENIVEVETSKKSSGLLSLTMLDSNIERAKLILTGLITTHNEESEKEKNLVGSKMLEFIESRLQEVGNKLETADEQIKEFKEKYKLTDIQSDATAYMEQATELMPLIIQARTQMEMANILDAYVQDPANEKAPIPLNPALINEAAAEAINKYNEELVKRNELLENPKKQSPISHSINTQLNSLRKNILSTLSTAKTGLQISLNGLTEKQKELENRFSDFPVMEKQYLAMKREQEIQQAVYLFLQQKKEETAVTSVSVMPKLRVIDEPHALVRPKSPSFIKTMMVVFFLGGVFIPLLLIYSEPLFKKIFRKKKHVE